MFVSTAAAAAQTDPGWGKLVALLVTAGVFWAGVSIHKRMINNPSPTEGESSDTSAKAQVAGGDVTTLTPIAPTAHEWGVVDHGAGGGRVTVPPRPADPAPGELDEWVAKRRRSGHRTAQIVREARLKFRRSERTIKRAVSRAKGGDKP